MIGILFYQILQIFLFPNQLSLNFCKIFFVANKYICYSALYFFCSLLSYCQQKGGDCDTIGQCNDLLGSFINTYGALILLFNVKLGFLWNNNYGYREMKE